MLAVWREWGLDKILKKAYQNGTIMCGVSAGAICWFEKGVTDSWADKLNIMNCLGFMKGSCCPHYDEEPERKPSLSKFIENKDIQNCYAIEGGCALHIKNEEVYSAISFRGKKNTFYVDYQSGKTVEKKLPVINI
jgi:aminopeptidase N